MLDILAELGTATAYSLWLPVLAWTVLALPLWALLERTDRLHPLAEYRLSQVLLAALPVGIGAVSVVEMLPDAARSSVLSAQSVVVLPAIEPTSTGAPAASWTWMHAVGLLTVGALGVGLFFLGRIALEVVAAGRIRQHLATAAAPSLRAEADRLRDRLNVHRPIRLCTTPDAAVPLTLGGLRPMILLPDRLVEATEELRMTLRHELVHIRRWDDCAHLAERLVAALFAAHPLVGRLRRQIAEARERACDAAVLDDGETPPASYARLLSAFADGASPHRLGALSLSESPSSLKNRLSAMRSSMPSLLSSRLALGTALVAIGLALTLGVVACSDSVAPPPSSSIPSEKSSAETAVADSTVPSSKIENSPMLVGGMKALQLDLSYPEKARKAGIEGQVVLEVVVDRTGSIRDLTVKQSDNELLREAALQAVKEQTFEPGHREDGERVPVRITLPVTFKLPGNSTSAKAGPSSSLPGVTVHGVTEGLPILIRVDGSIIVDGDETSISRLQQVVRNHLSTFEDQKAFVVRVESGASPERVRKVQEEIQPLLQEGHVSRTLYSTI
jgi:TonB family protein